MTDTNKTTTYGINPEYTLRQVYLMWLIHTNPRELLIANGITNQEITNFSVDNLTKWGDWND